jgi:hypothetical protein
MIVKRIDKFLNLLKTTNHSKYYNNNAKDKEVIAKLNSYDEMLTKTVMNPQIKHAYRVKIDSARRSYQDTMRTMRIAISTRLAKESRARAEKGSKKTNAERASHRASVKARRNALRSRAQSRRKTRKLSTIYENENA